MRTQTYFFYHARCQFSTIIMFIFMWPLESYFGLPVYLNLPIGQFFGAIIFWWIDNLILRNRTLDDGELWQFKSEGKCADCGYIGFVRRLARKEGVYDKSKDTTPKFRCVKCSEEKYNEIIENNSEIRYPIFSK